MKWWLQFLPQQNRPSLDEILLNIHKEKYPDSDVINAIDPEKQNNVFLLRERISRIYFLRKFFDYPLTLSLKTIFNLGILKTIHIGISYALVQIFPRKDERSLEDFFINRFGKTLYEIFFKSYTEKVWGVPCSQIKSEWGSQRIKGLSILKTLSHAIRKKIDRSSIKNAKVETSLIEEFLYPKYGPGQLWEEVLNEIQRLGGEIRFNHKVERIVHDDDNRIIEVSARTPAGVQAFHADYFFSSMPVKDLFLGWPQTPQKITNIAHRLQYRDFITVGLLLKKLKIKNKTAKKTINNIIPDNWIYIQEREVKLGRLQIFNNWSPYMVKDINLIWLGLEYFCNEDDELWSKNDNEFIHMAIEELASIGIINEKDILDSCILRVPKAYPAYFGAYEEFDTVKQYLSQFENLYCIGRNGMHRYNNMDHSMLTAMASVENIIRNESSKDRIWKINTEKEYHEEK